ncbi:MAG: HlyD family efflux transporter periplasmic adaptor subunit [Synergistaceae bacterium]|jgi:multidrug efflux pump subunit AcrA (membrane-fusion protein)|nr:HlyD family efflux transporter periplasmic adaptor subunit [Synergistaceae bacterium]
MKKELFNEEALSRLRSPEQLDSLLRITQPVTWMALLTLCVLTVAIVLWSVYGVLSVSVEGIGMIVDTAGVANVYHDASGKVAEITVRPGARVRKGDVVARLSQPSITMDIITSRQNIPMSANRSQVESGVSNFDSNVQKWYQSSTVISDYDGIVLEVPINQGDVVSAGSTVICSIRRDQERDDVTVLMYVKADEGKKVKPGMAVHLSPSEADAKKDGNLMGVVRDISIYPVSSAGMLKNLGNANVVSWITQKLDAAVMEVRVDLVRDTKTESGYLWTSVVGSHPGVTAGSVCTGNIVVERTPPLEKVFLKLSQWLRNA